jgi:hypothetical protein
MASGFFAATETEDGDFTEGSALTLTAQGSMNVRCGQRTNGFGAGSTGLEFPASMRGFSRCSGANAGGQQLRQFALHRR